MTKTRGLGVPASRSRSSARCRRGGTGGRRASSCARRTTSPSSATRWPSGCSTTGGSRRCCTRGFPKHELVVRNLGFSGDEVATRLRSKNFGTPDEWLSAKGARRSAATARTASRAPTPRRTSSSRSSATTSPTRGRRGWRRSRSSSTDWITHTLAQQYNGKTRPAPRAVLADRARGSRQSRSAGRPREQPAAGALHARDGGGREGASGVTFVDLFAPSRQLYAASQGAADDQRRPPEQRRATGRSPRSIDRALFGDPPRRPGGVPRRGCARRWWTRTSTGSTATA